MPHTGETRFPSARDGWIVWVLWIAVVVCFATPLAIPFVTAPFAVKVFAAPFLLLSGAFCLWLLLGTCYTLTESELIVASGPVRHRIPLSKIQSAEPMRDVVAAPALSTRRIGIRLDDAAEPFQISPKAIDDFLKELRTRAPRLQV